jgi:hypothetical protein
MLDVKEQNEMGQGLIYLRISVKLWESHSVFFWRIRLQRSCRGNRFWGDAQKK